MSGQYDNIAVAQGSDGNIAVAQVSDGNIDVAQGSDGNIALAQAQQDGELPFSSLPFRAGSITNE